MDPIAHRASAATSDPQDVTDLAARIRQNLYHYRRARYTAATMPLTDWERFNQTEAELERERNRGI